MNCHADIQRRLSAYCSGELDSSERQLVEMHLTACPGCRAELANLQTTLRLIRTTPEVESPPWLTSRIMAHLREEKTEKRSWLQWLRFPLQTSFPTQIVALLVVCVSGYYLSRSVETGLKLTAQQELHEMPAQQLPVPSPPATQQPDRAKKTELPTPEQPQKAATPAASPPTAPRQADLAPQTVPQLQPSPAAAPDTFVPPPPAVKDRFGGKEESKKSAPAAESLNRFQDATAEMRSKSVRSGERSSESAAPAAAGRAAGAGAAPVLPQAMVSLSLNDPSTAVAMIHEAVSRSGGAITEEQRSSLHRITARIPATRQNELLERLQRLGRIVERPATPATGTQLLEITIRW